MSFCSSDWVENSLGNMASKRVKRVSFPPNKGSEPSTSGVIWNRLHWDPLEFLAERKKIGWSTSKYIQITYINLTSILINTQYTRIVSQICHEPIVKVWSMNRSASGWHDVTTTFDPGELWRKMLRCTEDGKVMDPFIVLHSNYIVLFASYARDRNALKLLEWILLLWL